ncbi:hypothetical protein KK083_01095 [Fulvivirgaceae bacterium PWU4]|uniref:DUF6734 domain-containing protein n=1 Tax=Chryseosolibacter histidini TaxID=2782349 RepID=A0AAP2GGZ0_9BACT|nr:DUF6734 family protein [Chryseosolibacter histidini]MBT1695451.1 hypothetical protein [Chryseosolibacter histidini]
MKIIQSFWTMPMISGMESITNNRFSGGWLDWKYHLMSWALSCLQLRTFYNEVELFTDLAGKRLLIDRLQLPYTKVHVVLDELNRYDPGLWALGKIRTFSLQRTPFIHVDGDVFIWQKFPARLTEAALVAQNLEHNFSFYSAVLRELIAERCYVPPVMLDNYENEIFINAYNAGIIGGNDVSFFRDYTTQALQFVDNNLTNLGNISLGMFNPICEQHLYYCMAKQRNIPVQCYTDITDEKLLNTMLKGIDQFMWTPHSTQYIHLFGEDAKKNERICGVLAAKLNGSHPQYYQKVMEIVRENEAANIKF